MSGTGREAAVTALLTAVTGAFAWGTPPSRRLKLWSDVPKATRPACFLFEGGNETHANTMSPIGRRTVEVRLFVYTDASSTAVPPSSQLNDIADALDAALAPKAADIPLGRNTLGGAAYWARIEGSTLKAPGDLDGDGILVVPVRITLP